MFINEVRVGGSPFILYMIFFDNIIKNTDIIANTATKQTERRE